MAPKWVVEGGVVQDRGEGLGPGKRRSEDAKAPKSVSTGSHGQTRPQRRRRSKATEEQMDEGIAG